MRSKFARGVRQIRNRSCVPQAVRARASACSRWQTRVNHNRPKVPAPFLSTAERRSVVASVGASTITNLSAVFRNSRGMVCVTRFAGELLHCFALVLDVCRFTEATIVTPADNNSSTSCQRCRWAARRVVVCESINQADLRASFENRFASSMTGTP